MKIVTTSFQLPDDRIVSFEVQAENVWEGFDEAKRLFAEQYGYDLEKDRDKIFDTFYEGKFKTISE